MNLLRRKSSFASVGVAVFLLLGLTARSARSQTLGASLEAEHRTYTAGQVATLTGAGFQPGETIDLYISIDEPVTGTHVGDSEWPPFNADENGGFVTDYSVPTEAEGMVLFATAIGVDSGLTATFVMNNPAIVTTDQADYEPDTMATIHGAGFVAGEMVELQVLHADGEPAEGLDHEPWQVIADGNGKFETTWHVCADDCLGEMLELTATGFSSGLVAITTFTDHTLTLFTSTFGSSNTSTITVDGWSDGDGGSSNCQIEDGSSRSGSPTEQHARLEEGCAITKTAISIACNTAFQINYYFRGDSDAEVTDTLLVQWRATGAPSFTTVATHPLNNTTWSALQTVAVTPAAGTTSIEIRFVGNSSSDGEQARVDDVSVTATDHVANGTACADGLFCNGTDTCTDGVCVHTNPPCPGADGDDDCSETCDESTDLCTSNDPAGSACLPDAFECTNDVCNSSGVCTHPNRSGSCTDDGLECTNDTCSSGVCTHPNRSGSCTDDGNSCTNDTCSGGVCTHPNRSNGSSCAGDGIACTDDECLNGICVHDSSCDDGNACTVDACISNDSDCENPEDDEYDDCCTNTTLNCDDGNPCTTDSCNSVTGCVHTNNSNSCDDAMFCNGMDTCGGGTCSVHVGDPCPGADGDGNCSESCNEAADNCTAPDTNGSACTDGDFCTGTETCTAGACGSSTGDPCPGPDGDGDCSETCDEAANNCEGNDTNGSACTDGDFCTGTETCTAGACGSSTGDPCPGADGDGNCAESCNEGGDNCLADDPDGSTCTDDVYCNGTDTCDGGTCSDHTGDPCEGGGDCNDMCNETAENCLSPEDTPCADDGIECSYDLCDGDGTCTHPSSIGENACCSAITSSSLCSFDFDAAVTGDQFRLIFTPETASSWKLNASNPGQFYYNLFYYGSGNTPLTITLPYPFVTQGATPIHVYDGASGDGECFIPGNEIANSTTQVTLASYVPQSFGSTKTITVNLPNLPGGSAYIAMHLDYGLKKNGVAYGKNGNADALSTVSPYPILIPNGQSYTAGNSCGTGDAVQSSNMFKRANGIGGLGLHASGESLAGAKVEIYNSSNKLAGTAYTDEDGWYMWQYKYTGKATTFTVKLPAYKLSKSVTLKSNGFVIANFDVP